MCGMAKQNLKTVDYELLVRINVTQEHNFTWIVI